MQDERHLPQDWVKDVGSGRAVTHGRCRGTKVGHPPYLEPRTDDETNRLVGKHREIKNSLHLVLDLTFDEDRSRSRKGSVATKLTNVRKMVPNAIRLNNTYWRETQNETCRMESRTLEETAIAHELNSCGTALTSLP